MEYNELTINVIYKIKLYFLWEILNLCYYVKKLTKIHVFTH